VLPAGTSILPNPHPPAGVSFTFGVFCFVLFFSCSPQLTPEFTQRLNNKIRELLQQMERGLKSTDPQDCTTYTGWAGRVADWIGWSRSSLERASRSG